MCSGVWSIHLLHSRTSSPRLHFTSSLTQSRQFLESGSWHDWGGILWEWGAWLVASLNTRHRYHGPEWTQPQSLTRRQAIWKAGPAKRHPKVADHANVESRTAKSAPSIQVSAKVLPTASSDARADLPSKTTPADDPTLSPQRFTDHLPKTSSRSRGDLPSKTVPTVLENHERRIDWLSMEGYAGYLNHEKPVAKPRWCFDTSWYLTRCEVVLCRPKHTDNSASGIVAPGLSAISTAALSSANAAASGLRLGSKGTSSNKD